MISSRIRQSLFTTVLAAGLGFASATSADDKRDRVPFKAVFTISEVVGEPASECLLSAPPGGGAASGTISGTGLASGGLGALTMTSVDCITSASPLLLPPMSFSSNNVVLVASNGDLLMAMYSGKGLLLPHGILNLTGSFTFTGGTGRFSGVQGNGTVEGLESIVSVPAIGHFILSGTISR